MGKEMERLRAYHRLSMHRPGRPAPAPRGLDWKNRPDPFRRFAGARLFDLPAPAQETDEGPTLAALDRPGRLRAQPLAPASLASFLELSLGLTAWKQAGGNSWALRANPSSGNLHPGEGYVLLPRMEGMGETAGLYHYAPGRHALEERATIVEGSLSDGGFLFGLSTIPWRQSWKYGERALRYCLLDAGHVLGTVCHAAATLGWRARLVAEISDSELARLLGLDKTDQWLPGEKEVPEFLIWIQLSQEDSYGQELKIGPVRGQPNRLSNEHREWPEMAAARPALTKPSTDPQPSPAPSAPADPAPPTGGARRLSAREVIRRRRSATEMNGRIHMPRAPFFRILRRCMTDPQTVPWNGFPYPPRIALLLFVHHVRGVPPGLYLLGRDEARLAALRQAMRNSFQWKTAHDYLPLHLLAPGDFRRQAQGLAFDQEIVGDGVFSVAMIADFAATLEIEGAWAYRRLHWEAGLLGQVLYLEAEAAGLGATGIGAPVADPRLSTLPAYHNLAAERASL